ncbi:MAG: hypothetical protein HON68_02890 [Gammaproteobacteria bacterium]|jgi:uncharacterized protein Smg (DUF494 family)|nr:hypothetical protein [Gammaproteobacteria bacterium]MBT3490331.1 hypothetical protein [Gammaproteobacteria bacterium]MBT3718783.1 hypothetical protein [Gammaproteobacteria bacterium]MBT3844517.1 hypothetical protein [Gammaproteobacteria bacterium]MBT3894380.1 hypothetical protein [Gammaproteobacteria bacterium]
MTEAVVISAVIALFFVAILFFTERLQKHKREGLLIIERDKAVSRLQTAGFDEQQIEKILDVIENNRE